MKKLFLFGLLISILSSCLDSDDNTRIVDRLIAFDSVSVPQDTVDLNQEFYAYISFDYNPNCESLYTKYYYQVDDNKRYIAPIAQVRLDDDCSEENALKTITDSILFKLDKAGTYHLLFYKGQAEEKDSATFYSHKIFVENN